MRLFVSIKLPEETLGYLENCIASLSHLNKRSPVKWYDRSLLHSTVLFLGEVEEDKLTFIKEQIGIEVAKLKTFFLDISAPEIFFKSERPSTIYMKTFDQSGMLQELHNNLQSSLKKEINLEIRPYHPHITLGKVKGGIPRRKKINIKTGHIDSIFSVTEIVLLETVPTPIGSLFTALYTAEVPNG